MKYKVLIIDDEPALTKFYVTALERLGFEAQTCLNVDKALEMVEEGPDLVILDIMMPPMMRYSIKETAGGMTTGVLLYHDIRRVFPRLPIIVLTNVKVQSTLDRMPKEEFCWIRHKDETLPTELAELVKSILTLH